MNQPLRLSLPGMVDERFQSTDSQTHRQFPCPEGGCGKVSSSYTVYFERVHMFHAFLRAPVVLSDL
jgi:hypothetical protein